MHTQIHTQVLVGGEGGKVLRGGWAGTAPAPKQYLTEDHRAHVGVVEPGSPASVLAGSVVCIAVSPAQPMVSVHATCVCVWIWMWVWVWVWVWMWMWVCIAVSPAQPMVSVHATCVCVWVWVWV